MMLQISMTQEKYFIERFDFGVHYFLFCKCSRIIQRLKPLCFRIAYRIKIGVLKFLAKSFDCRTQNTCVSLHRQYYSTNYSLNAFTIMVISYQYIYCKKSCNCGLKNITNHAVAVWVPPLNTLQQKRRGEKIHVEMY